VAAEVRHPGFEAESSSGALSLEQECDRSSGEIDPGHGPRSVAVEALRAYAEVGDGIDVGDGEEVSGGTHTADHDHPTGYERLGPRPGARESGSRRAVVGRRVTRH
jgi:hypothetical protein